MYFGDNRCKVVNVDKMTADTNLNFSDTEKAFDRMEQPFFEEIIMDWNII